MARSWQVTTFHGKTINTRQKGILCVWWDQKGIIYYELLKPKQRLSEALQKKRPFSGKGKRKIILLHDNVRPHVAKTTKGNIENLGREVLPHPAYSPDLASPNYHLFRSMQHFFQEKKLHER